MIRKLTIAMTMGVLVFSATNGQAQAPGFRVPGTTVIQEPAVIYNRPVPGPRHHHIHFDVYYKNGWFGNWKLYGSFRSEWEAERAVHHLRHHGFTAKIREHV